MADGRSEVQWSPRVPKWKIRRLYESDAQGILDEELLDDVGITLLLRCRDILAIHEAKHGRIECPRCARCGERTVIKRSARQGDVRDEVITCSECGWQITWGEYALSFKRKQLNAEGAVEAFQRYVRDYSAARTPQEKLLAVDRLIHEFHHSFRDQPDRPCRPVGVNLIEGKLPDVVQFLDELTYGQETPEGLRERLTDWRTEMRRTSWPDLVGPQEGCIVSAAASLRPGGYVYVDNDHIEGKLDEAWRKPGVSQGFPSGTCTDGTWIESTIRPYDPQRDEEQVYELWQRTLGQAWPLSQATFHYVTLGSTAYQPGDHVVAQVDQEVVGFVGTQAWLVPGECVPRGELMLIMVDPAHQRRGIGRALLECALIVLHKRGAGEVQVGGGGLSYFWPGVPANLPAAWPFFQACGWTEAERSFDLVLDLSGYVTPPGVYERIRLPGVVIATGTPGDGPALLAFEARHFPIWYHFYQEVMGRGGHADVVLARHPDYGIVGASCAGHPRVVWRQHDFVWEQLLGQNVGELGPLGVLEAVRENGIGLALAARVTELLRERGAETSYVGWTWLVDWYGRLGYRVWREYVMSWKRL